MSSSSVDKGDWQLECVTGTYTKQTILSRDYELFLNKHKTIPNLLLNTNRHVWHIFWNLMFIIKLL